MIGTHVGADHVHEEERTRYYDKGRKCYACGGSVNGFRKPITGCEDHLVYCHGCERKMGDSFLSSAEYLMKHHGKEMPPKKPSRRFPLPRLRDARIERGLTRNALSAATERKGTAAISVEMIGRIEERGVETSHTTAHRLARALWVDLGELTGEGAG